MSNLRKRWVHTRVSFLSAVMMLSFVLPAPASVEDPDFVLAGPKISLTFDYDAEMGIRLLQIIHHEGGDFTFDNNADVPGYPGLWEIRGELNDPEHTKYVVKASPAADFQASETVGPEGEPALKFQWSHVPIPGTTDLITVELWVSLKQDENEEVSRWHGVIQREEGSTCTASIDEFDYPAVCIKGPITPKGGEFHKDAQWRARVLIPVSAIKQIPASNLPMGYYLNWNDPTYSHPSIPSAQAGPDKAFFYTNHPSAGQVFQFSTLYNADMNDAGYRRMLYMGTEDQSGHFKEFRHHFISTQFLKEGFYFWAPTTFPAYANLLGETTEYGNEFTSFPDAYPDYPFPFHPAVLGALTAKGDDFWYDATAYYRSYMESDGPQPEYTYEHNIKLKEFSRGPHMMHLPVPLQGEGPPFSTDLYDYWLDLTKIWRKMLDNRYIPISDFTTYLHFNFYLKNAEFGLADYPVFNSVDPELIDTISDAIDENIRVSVRTFPMALYISFQPIWYNFFLPQAYEAYGRHGILLRYYVDNPNRAYIDYPHDAGAEFWYSDPLHIHHIWDLGVTGFYMDGVSGVASKLTYDNPTTTEVEMGGGGDRYVTKLVEGIDRTREILVAESPHLPQDGEDVHLASEGPQEYMPGCLDFIGWGYDFIPYHLQLIERYLIQEGYFPRRFNGGVPEASRDWSPPLWHAVYHEYQPGQPMMAPLNTASLATNKTVHPSDGGLDIGEFVEFMAYNYGAVFLGGAEPTTLLYFMNADFPMVLLDEHGNLTNDPVTDPDCAGLVAAEAIRNLFGALERDYAGKYILYGRMQRPLKDMNLDAPFLAVNPTSVVVDKVNENFVEYVLLNMESHACHGGLPNLPFDIPKVQHSTWKSPEDSIGLIFYNWSGNAANFEATFDPTLYEINSSYNVSLLQQDGPAIALGAFTGSIDIHFGTGGGDLNRPSIPPRDLVVLELTGQ